MKRLQSLTIAQAMAFVFLSGFSIALFFGVGSLAADMRQHAALHQDRAIVDAAREVGTIVGVLQAERGLTYTWMTAPSPWLETEVARQRLATDDVLSRLDRHGSAGAAQRREHLGIDRQGLLTWLDQRRTEADADAVTPAALRDAMTARNAALTGSVARDARSVHSPHLAALLRDLATIMAAKDAVGLQGALGGAILALGDTGQPVPPELRHDLRDQAAVSATWLDGFRMAAEDAAGASLTLHNRASTMQRFSDWHAMLTADSIADAGAAGAGSADSVRAWFAEADALVDTLVALEDGGAARLHAALEAEMRTASARIRTDAALLAGLSLVFGGVAFLVGRAASRSVGDIIRTIGRLSVDAGGTQVIDCPQEDLRRISAALRVLRSVQMERQMHMQAAEDIRCRVDHKLDGVLTAAAGGNLDGRIDVLGLDAHGAVLARGINRLLDQLERDKRASA